MSPRLIPILLCKIRDANIKIISPDRSWANEVRNKNAKNSGFAYTFVMFYVYILRTTGNTFYIGQTNNLKRRLSEHKSHGSRTAKYLYGFTDCHLVYFETYQTRSEAMRREYKLKQLTHDQKESMVQEEEDLINSI